MNFYLSSRLNNADQVRYVASRLTNKGWRHTCDWTSFDLSSEDSPDSLQRVAEREWEGIKAADIVIVLTPQGRGTHMELGMAIALGKIVYVYHTDDTYFRCDDNTCAFYWLPQVKRVAGEIDAVVEAILRETPNRSQ